MGPLLVLVSPCFRENVNVTCKIVSFLCSIDNFLLKNAIVFFFGNQISKWPSFEKGVIFDLLFTIFSYQGKDTNIPSAHIPTFLQHIFHLHTRILLTLLTCFAFPILQKLRIYHVWFLFCVTPGVDSFHAILKQSINNKMVSKI